MTESTGFAVEMERAVLLPDSGVKVIASRAEILAYGKKLAQQIVDEIQLPFYFNLVVKDEDTARSVAAGISSHTSLTNRSILLLNNVNHTSGRSTLSRSEMEDLFLTIQQKSKSLITITFQPTINTTFLGRNNRIHLMKQAVIWSGSQRMVHDTSIVDAQINGYKTVEAEQLWQIARAATLLGVCEITPELLRPKCEYAYDSFDEQVGDPIWHLADIGLAYWVSNLNEYRLDPVVRMACKS